jgi:hypothetical protein
MYLTEPVTALTDYLLAAASFAFALAIRRRMGPHNRLSGWYWCAAFVASALAAIAGGTFHGFAWFLAPETLRALWNVTMFSIGACAAFIAAGVRAGSFKAGEHSMKWLTRGIVLTVVGLLVLLSRLPRATHFNYNDAYHLIQLAGLYCFFRCARS